MKDEVVPTAPHKDQEQLLHPDEGTLRQDLLRHGDRTDPL